MPLATIEGGAFNGLSSLQSLNLSYNKITTLPSGVFEGLSSLTKLNLDGNPSNFLYVDAGTRAYGHRGTLKHLGPLL